MSRPKTRRRKPISCALCETDTYDREGVCRDCRFLWEKGKVAAELEAAGEAETELVLIGRWFRLSRYDAEEGSIFDGHKLNGQLRDVLVQLSGAVPSSEKDTFFARNHPFIGNAPKSEAPPSTLYRLQKGRAELMQRVLELVRAMKFVEYKKGQSDSDRFLQRLSDGELSIEQVQDRYARKE